MEFVQFKKGEKYPEDYDNLIISEDPDSFDSCGIMIPKDVVVVDIDVLNRDALMVFLLNFEVTTPYYLTDRGIHLYYTKPKKFKQSAEHICSLGFNVEFKTGKFVTYKLEGKSVREFENQDNDYEELPDYFKPQKSLDNLLGLVDNEGRYNKLFKYAQRLAKSNDKATILNFINEHVFGEPMSDKNFNSILGSKPSESSEDLTDLFGICKHAMRHCRPVMYYSKQFWLINGNYTGDSKRWERWLTNEVPTLNPTAVRTIIEMVEMRCTYYDAYREWSVKLPNGVLNKGSFIEMEGFLEFTPFTLPYEYDANAKCPPALRKFLNVITDGDEGYQQYLIDMVAWGLVINDKIRKKHPKIHIIVGDGGNGKGLLMNLFRKATGSANYSTVKLHELTDKNMFNDLRNSLANYGEDVEDLPIGKELFSRIKNITALDPVTVRELYEGAESDVIVHSNLIFTSNHILQAFERGESVERRLVWCPMFGQIKTELTDEEFEEIDSVESIKYITKLLVDAYCRLYTTREFTKCPLVDEFTGDTIENDDYLGTYIKEIPIARYVYNKPKDIYSAFEEYCDEEGIANSVTNKKFMTELHKTRGTTTASRKNARGYSVRMVVPNTKIEKGKKLALEAKALGLSPKSVDKEDDENI